MPSYTTKEKDFIKYVKTRCKEHGVKCVLNQSKYSRFGDGTSTSGWFDEGVPELVVSVNRPDWIEILVHEYSHLTQWVEQIPVWKKAEISLPIMWDWLAGKDHPRIMHHINVCRDLELDNEKRSVQLIQTFGLNVDIDWYIRKANSYVYFYNWIKKTRRWSIPPNTPYANERLVSAMPKRFLKSYTTIPKRIEKIFEEENI